MVINKLVMSRDKLLTESNYRDMNAGIPPVILKASRTHTASLIFLHGLGDTGFGWAGALNSIKPDFLKVICPTAPMQPVTINGGAAMPAWYDIMSLDETDSDREDMEGVDWATEYLNSLVEGEVQQGMARDRVIIGGFSQGGAVAVRAALMAQGRLGGCIALSCYLPGDNEAYSKMSLKDQTITPIFQAHGDMDNVVSYKRGQITSEVLKSLVKNHTFTTYKGMGHEGTQEELEDIKSFIISSMA